MKLGSLFDGAGTCPLAGSVCGVKPIWASEIEPFPVAVSSSNFPSMEHLGDITQIHGDKITPVDIITFGSPCQDLSVAGRRAGLDGERSGLFMEAVRIIKEMRCATHGKYPQIVIWENVPGAFSSNKGEDFRTVLEELCKISDPGANVPRPPKRGGTPKWSTVGEIMGNGYSVAWRVLDAKFWGVPQRRRRVFLVLDLGGGCAGEVLFKRKGLRRDFKAVRSQRKTAAGNPENGAGTPSGATPYTLKVRAGCNGGGKGALIQNDLSSTLSSNGEQQTVFQPIIALATQQGGAEIRTDDACPCLTAAAGMSGNNQPVVCIPINDKATRFQGGGSSRHNDGAGNGLGIGNDGDPCPTLTVGDRHAVCTAAYGFKGGQSKAHGIGWEKETAATLNADMGGLEPTVCYAVENHAQDNRVKLNEDGIVQTLASRMGTGGGQHPADPPAQRFYRQQRFGDFKEDDASSTILAHQGKDFTDVILSPKKGG